MIQLKYQMVIQWSEEDECFLVGFPDFPGQKWRVIVKLVTLKKFCKDKI